MEIHKELLIEMPMMSIQKGATNQCRKSQCLLFLSVENEYNITLLISALKNRNCQQKAKNLNDSKD
jgi:hypothetical protein